MDQTMQLANLCAMDPSAVAGNTSATLIRSVIRLRSVKSNAELAQIEAALVTNAAMQTTAMRMATPGRYEREVVGAIEGLAYGQSGRNHRSGPFFQSMARGCTTILTTI
jgi:Xaa-Pro aminopeptidase